VSLAVVSCSWFVSPGSNAVAYRALGLTTLAIAVGLAFISPRWVRDRRRLGRAQVAVGLYASVAALSAGLVAGVIALAAPRWVGDPLSAEGNVLVLSLVLLAGSLLTASGAAKLGRSPVSAGCLLGFPFLICSVADALLLGYVWLGPIAPATTAQCGTGPSGRVVFMLAACSLLVSLGLLAAPLAVLAKEGGLVSALFPAVTGVSAVMVFLFERGKESWYAGSRLAGMDHLLVFTFLGCLIFGGVLIAGRRESVPEPAVAEVSVYTMPEAA